MEKKADTGASPTTPSPGAQDLIELRLHLEALRGDLDALLRQLHGEGRSSAGAPGLAVSLREPDSQPGTDGPAGPKLSWSPAPAAKTPEGVKEITGLTSAAAYY